MSVDFTGWKSGDRGVMEVEFEFVEHGAKTENVKLTSSVAGGDWWHDPALIKSITRIEPPIKAGDRVRYMGEQWVVHGLSGQHAWLHSFAHKSGCGYITQPICNLERIA